MADPIVPPNPAPPVTPPPQPPPVDPPTPPVDDTPEQPPEPQGNVIDDPLFASLKADLGLAIAEPVEPAITPVAEPPVTPTAEPPAPVVPPAEPAKKTRKRVTMLETAPIEPAPVAPPAAPPTPPPAAPAPVADPDAEYIQGLNDEQREELSEAEHAAKMYPERYRNRRAELLNYYRRVDKFATDNPENTRDDNEDFKKVLSSKPVLSAVDQKRVIRDMAVAQAKVEIEQSNKPELDQIKREQRFIKEQPAVQTVVQQFGAALHEAVVDDEKIGPVAKLIKEKGIDEAVKEYPLESRIVHDENIRAQALARDYTQFAKQVVDFDDKNENHVWLSQFVQRQCDVFKAKGEQMRNGKQFLSRSEFAEYTKTHRDDPMLRDKSADGRLETSKYWTFSHRDMLSMIGENARITMQKRIEHQEKWAQENGFTRAPKPNSAPVPNPTTPAPTPIEPTRARASAAPGASIPAPIPPTDGAGVNVVSTLYPK